MPKFESSRLSDKIYIQFVFGVIENNFVMIKEMRFNITSRLEPRAI